MEELTGNYVLVYLDDSPAFAVKEFDALQEVTAFITKHGLTRYDFAILEGTVVKSIVRTAQPRHVTADDYLFEDTCISSTEDVDEDAISDLIGDL